MTFRENETSKFPIGSKMRGIWYAIVVFDKRFPKFDFSSSKSGEVNFIRKIKSLKDDGQSYLLMGIWQGKFSTDIFVLDEELVIKMIESLYTDWETYK